MKNALKAAFFLAILGLTSAEAASSIWTGNSSSTSNWSDTANWQGGARPATNYTTTAVMAGTNGLNSNVNTTQYLYGLNFASNAGSFVLSGQDIFIRNGGIVSDSPNTQTILNNIILASPTSQTWDITDGNLFASGSISGRDGHSVRFIKDGNGILTLNGTTANTNTGDFVIDDGTVVLGKTAGVTAIAGDIEIGDATLTLNTSNQIVDSSDMDIGNYYGMFNLNDNQETIRSLSGVGNVYLGSGRLTISGNASTSFGGSISGTGGLTINGTSSLTLSGINSYTGETILSGGTLQLGRDQTLANLSALTLSGGSLKTRGYDQKFGVLTLNADSTIDLSSGSSILSFSNSSGVAWDSSATLTIKGWNGSRSGGSYEQLLVGANGLTTQQLSQVQFFNPEGLAAGTYGATLLSSGEVVPVPEPATIGLGVALLGLLGVKIRRRKEIVQLEK